jgi:hypothetical protein
MIFVYMFLFVMQASCGSSDARRDGEEARNRGVYQDDGGAGQRQKERQRQREEEEIGSFQASMMSMSRWVCDKMTDDEGGNGEAWSHRTSSDATCTFRLGVGSLQILMLMFFVEFIF